MIRMLSYRLGSKRIYLREIGSTTIDPFDEEESK
jgi:hypothetical protein